MSKAIKRIVKLQFATSPIIPKMNNKTLAVVSQSGQSLSFFDVDTGALTGQLKDLAPEPHELAYDDRTNLLYITHAYKDGWYVQHSDACTEISVVDCLQKKVVDVIDISPHRGPHGIALDKQNDILYVSTEEGLEDQGGPGGLVGIDLKTRKVVKAVGAGWKVHWFVLTPDGKKAFTCNKEAGFISILDMDQEKMLGKIDLPGGCEGPAISKDGRFAYFPTPTVGIGMKGKQGDFHIQVIDTQACKRVQAIQLEFGAVALHVDSKDRLLVGQYRFGAAPTEGKMQKPLPGRLTVLSSPEDHFRQLGTFETDLVPLTVFAAPDAGRAFAANVFSGTVTVVDLDQMVHERSLAVDTETRKDKLLHQGAHGLALIP